MEPRAVFELLGVTAHASKFPMCGQWRVVGWGSEGGAVPKVLSGGFDTEEAAWSDSLRVAGLRVLGETPFLPCAEFPLSGNEAAA